MKNQHGNGHDCLDDDDDLHVHVVPDEDESCTASSCTHTCVFHSIEPLEWRRVVVVGDVAVADVEWRIPLGGVSLPQGLPFFILFCGVACNRKSVILTRNVCPEAG